MYLPKNRYKVVSSSSSPLVTEAGEEYSGPYLQAINNTKYKGNKPGGNLERVYFKEELEQGKVMQIEIPFNEYYLPTRANYNNGEFKRYLLYLKKENLFKEVSLSSYLKFKNDNNIDLISLKWRLAKPYENIETNGIVYEGSITRNQKVIDELSIKYPTIVDFLDANQYLI